MTRERHAIGKKIFLEACALDPEKQGEFLSRACAGDSELRREIDRLLANHVSRAALNSRPLPGPATTPADPPLYQTGQVVADRYRIVTLIGVGGMGEVYRAEDSKLAQSVALKFLPADLASDPMLRRRFELEVRLAREVTHSYVARVHDIAYEKGTPFISMEYVDGENLSSLLKRTGRLSGPKVVEIAQQLCLGLSAAHARGVLHRDLKPANVMLDNRGRVRITDFGLAGVVGQIHPWEIRSGTPRYMAPEQLAGEGVSERSDIYSLGLILYELLCGRAAFDAASTDEFIRQHRESRPLPPSQVVPDVDPALEAIIMSCLEKDPASRPCSALEVAAALPGGNLLAAALGAGEIPTPSMLAISPPQKAIVKPVLVWMLAACVALLVIGLGVTRRVHPILHLESAQAPALIESAGRQLMVEAGLPMNPADVACRYAERSEYSLPNRGSKGDLQLGASPSDAPLFYMRASFAGRIEPENLHSPFVSTPGGTLDVDREQTQTVLLGFEPDARLALFDASMMKTVTGALEESPSWENWASRSGLKLADFKPAQPMLSHYFRDEHRVGFEARPDSPPAALTRIEAASRNGRASFFAVMSETLKVQSHFELDVDQRRSWIKASRNSLFLLLLIASIPAAWMNWRHGGSDARGAIRLGIFVGLLRLCVNVLTARHVPHLPDEINLLTMGVFNSLAEGFLVGILYLAFERHIRRVWPATLAGWSRVMRGRFRDQQVGRDILVGCVVGPLWAVLGSFEYLLPDWLGWKSRASLRFMDEYQYLMGSRFAAASCLDWLIHAVYVGLLVLLLLVILRVVVRREFIALWIAWFIVALMYVPAGRHPLSGWLIIGLGGIAVAIYILVHFGLISFVVAAFLNKLIISFPFTLDLQEWYAGYGMFAAAVTIGLAMFGFIQALRVLSTPDHRASLRPHS